MYIIFGPNLLIFQFFLSLTQNIFMIPKIFSVKQANMCSRLSNTVLYSECAKCRSKHDGAIILTFRKLYT